MEDKHETKPATLKNDHEEDVTNEEDDDYDELDELPLLQHFRMAEQYLREKNCSPQKRLEELQKKDKRTKKKV
jgi:hypothetical protein